jgi:hypothetical protein
MTNWAQAVKFGFGRRPEEGVVMSPVEQQLSTKGIDMAKDDNASWDPDTDLLFSNSSSAT